jgi:6-phosphogluconolactonase
MVLHAIHGLAAFLAGGAVLCVMAGFAQPARSAEAAAATAAGAAGAAGDAGKMLVYIGGAGGKQGGAIYRCRIDLASGALSEPELTVEAIGPTFQVIHPSGKFLYSVNEGGKFNGAPGGGVSAYAIAPGTGALTPLNAENTGGAWPCFVTVDKAGNHLLGANYGGGSVFAFALGADGKIGQRTALVQHEGKGPDPKRQEAPHAHSINLDPAGRFALACDLGLDKVLVYRFDAEKGTLSANDPPSAAASAPGAGPRHLAFHPSGKWAYVINEMGKGVSWCAEVQVHPSGKFVYGSNRGHDSIVMFSVDAQTGKLTVLGQEPTQGKHPRNFRIDPTGTYLLVANRDTSNVVVFRIDAATGLLKATGHVVKVPGPNCVKFLAM